MIDVVEISLPYIEKNPRKSGSFRYFFRVNGKRIARLPDDPQSEEFVRRYWEARRAFEARPAPPVPARKGKQPLPGTFHALCASYLASDPFQQLDATTKAKRQQIINSMLVEPVRPGAPETFADMPIAAVDAANIEVLRDRKKDTPFAADERLKILRQVFETTRPGRDGKPERIAKLNHAKLVAPYRVKSDGHHTIRDDEIAKFVAFHGPTSKATLALVLLMYTGMRVSDLQAIGPQHRRGDSLVFRVFKNRNRTPTRLEIPIHPVLDKVLALHPAKSMNYLVTEYGSAFSVKGLGARVSDWFTQAGLPHCSAHSVRKGLATSLAENEATDSMLDGFFGWKDGKTSKIYTRQKQQAKLARQAVDRIDWGGIANVLPQPETPVASQDGERKKNAI